MGTAITKEYLKNLQYGTTENLDARIKIHQLFSTNPESFHVWIGRHLTFAKPVDVLELGCGTGIFWKENLHRLHEGSTLTLTDFSPAMVEKTRATLGEAAQMLNAEGFASRSGKPITTAYLSVLYRSPQMLGHLAHTPKGGTAEVILDDDGHPFFWTEPILDEATVARYERVMGARNGGGKPGRKPGAANPTPRSLLTSVLYCEACEGGKLHAQYQKGSVASNYYRCSDRCRPATAIPLDDADAWVTNAVLRRLAALDRNDSPILDFIASHWVERSGTATPVSEVEDEIEVVSAALAKVQREFYAQVGRDSFMDDETYASITADLTRRLEDATVLLREARLATVDAGDVFADFLPSAGSTDGNPAESESWLSLPLHKRRQLINMVIDRITVSQQEPRKVRPGWERRVSIEWVQEDRVEDFFTRFASMNSRRIIEA